MNSQIRPATVADADAIAAIYNEGIEDRVATFETEPRSGAELASRIDDLRYPMLVSIDARGNIDGWAGTSSYRTRACYASIAEFSIYMARGARGEGRGRPLLDALIAAARESGFTKLVSRIFLFNAGSRALCRRCGFREVGVYEKHGQLDGRWLDVVIVERLIPENLMRAGAPR